MNVASPVMSLVLLLSAFSVMQFGPPQPDLRGSVVVGGVSRSYAYHAPPRLGTNVPLVLVFHGHFMTGEQQSEMTHLDRLADERGFVVVYPDGIHRGWNDGRARDQGPDDIGFTQTLIATFSQRYAIDPKRIYVTGFSNGATFAEYVGCTLAAKIAAIAPVSGPLPTAIAPSCHPARALPVLAIDGTADPLVPYGGGQITIAGQPRGAVLSAQANVAFWRTNARCSPAPRIIARLAPVPPTDGTSVSRTVFTGCVRGTSVVLYTVNGGGHAWPQGPQYLPKAVVGKASNQLDASQTIVDFFYAHPLR